MKLASKILLSVLLVQLWGCNKEEVNLKNYPELKGDYNWEMSYFQDFTTVHKEEIDARFGLRIKSRKKVEIYRNGTLEISGEIISASENTDGSIAFNANFGAHNHDFQFANNQLKSNTYPFDAIYNLYSKE